MSWKTEVFEEVLDTTVFLEAIIQISPEGFPLNWKVHRGTELEVETLAEMALSIWRAACRSELASERESNQLTLTTAFGGMSIAQGADQSLLLLLSVGQDPQLASELFGDLSDASAEP